MSTLTLEHEPLAAAVTFSGNMLTVQLTDGRSLAVRLEWYPRLAYATDLERGNWQLLGDGYAIEWSDLDEHIGVAGLLAGHRSGESTASFQRWLVSRRNT
jgi:hypothetical protein